MGDQRDFDTLVAFVARVPSVVSPVGFGTNDDGYWWVKFAIDIFNPAAWHAVQELSCVLNYLSLSERLPTVFYPVSPAPYLNGGPEESLSWVIESRDTAFKPGTAAEWLEARLPSPVEDLASWPL